MPQKVRCTALQKRKMVEYMSLHPLFANGEFQGPLGIGKYEAEWRALARTLREFGPEKSVKQWKITWRDLKRKARVDNAASRRQAAVTGNSETITEVGDEELMVLSVIGVESSEGVGPPESGFGEVEDAVENSPVSSPVYSDTDTDPWTPGRLLSSSTLESQGLLACPADPSRRVAPAPAPAAAPARAPPPALTPATAFAPAPTWTPAPAPLRTPSTSRASAPTLTPAPAPLPTPSTSRASAPTLTPAPAPPAPWTARGPGPPYTPAQAPRAHPTVRAPAHYLQLQQELNTTLQGIHRELARGNELRERQLAAFQEHMRLMTRQRLDDTQLLESFNMD